MIRTETTTVVFTDLVGSTALTSRLGHDSYEAMRRPHFASLRLAAADHNGVEIKSTGDGLVFAFSSASDAVCSMIRMQQATELAARLNNGDPRIRVGASSGETTRDGNDIFGIAVVEAARLCAAAAPGQILVSDLIKSLNRGLEFDFRNVGQLVLKGIPEPVSACEIEWKPLASREGAVPLPPKIPAAPAFGLYGRAAEQAALAAAWEAAKRGERRVMLLGGEPGIGKTRLSAEAARLAHGEGATILFGSCDEDISHPYRPFVEALRHYVVNAPDDVLLHHVREHRGELLRIAPELAQRMPTLPRPQAAEPETERYLMFEAVTGLIAAASAATPLVLILDDLQWAGMPELLLLRHIVRSGLPMRLMIIATYRETELSRTHPLTALLADLRRESGTERIAVRGLDEEGVIAFVTAAAGHALDAGQIEFARAIGRETEGSPLFMGEILRNLVESGAVFRDGERWAVRGELGMLGIPEGVKDAIGRRLSRLSESTNKVLSLASVIGREFDLELLTRLAELSEDAVLDAVDEAKAAMLVAEVAGEAERYAFTHVLMRSTLYEEINPARRARMHRRVGLALEALTATRPARRRIDELTRHWMAATNVGDAAKAAGYARQAGDRALTELAFEEAARYYEQALVALEPQEGDADPLRCDLLIALGDAQRRAGDLSYRGTVTRALALARSLGDARRFALAVLGNARPGGLFADANVVDQNLIALYDEAIAKLADADEPILRAKLRAQLAIELLYTPQRDRRHQLSREAVETARQHGDKAVLAQTLYAHAVAVNVPTTLADRLALTAELRALADEIGNLETGWYAGYQRFGALLESAEIEGAELTLAQLEAVAAKLRQAYFSWAPAVARAMLAVMRGAPDAEQRANAAYRVGKERGQPDAKTVYLSQLFVIRRDQGRYGELVGPLREVVESQPHIPAWRIALAGLYCETDQLEEARAQMSNLAGGAGISLDWTWASAVANLAQVCADLRERTVAARIYPELLPVAGQVGVTGIALVCYGSLALPCGLLAACLERWDDAEHHLRQAIKVNERIGARPYLVRTRRAYAQMLLDRSRPGDGERAAGLISNAIAEAERLGMKREIVRLGRLSGRTSGQAVSA